MRKTWKTINTIIGKQHDKSNVSDKYCIDNVCTDNPDIILMVSVYILLTLVSALLQLFPNLNIITNTI